MNDDLPLYNSRITKNYLEFLAKFYPDIDPDPLLEDAGMTRFELEDPGHWFSQNQVDRFHVRLVRATGKPTISRDVGRYLTSSEGLGPIKQYMLGLLNPLSIYMLMGKVYNMFSRAAKVETRKLSRAAVEITSTPVPGAKEKLFQCENRLGSFESIARLFTKGFAKIEHPTCFHRGDPACRYLITWESMSSLIWKRIRNAAMVVSFLGVLVLFFFYPIHQWGLAAAAALVGNMLLGLYSLYVERGELIKTIETQGNAAEELFGEINTRYNDAVLIKEIGQATAAFWDIDQLIAEAARVMEKRLDFDRGMILLADDRKKRLRFVSGYGYDDTQLDLLNRTRFHLDKPESRGSFVVAFREQTPHLIHDISEIENTLSERSLDFAHRIGVQSLICVPIVYEKESLGVLAVDNIKTQRPATQSDISLLVGVTSQIAVGIINTRSVRKLQESEKKYRDLVENANSIILRRDVSGKITFFNEFAQGLFRYLENEILGKNIIGTLFPDTPAARQELQQLATSLQNDPDRRLITENLNVTRNGQRVWVAWTYKPIFDNQGALEEILCIGNDITELKHAEQEKKELETRLQRAQKMEAVGTLAGGVAHDLNNILSGIVSYPELILMGLPENSPLRKPVVTMQKSGEKAAAIVQDLLTLARRGVVSKLVVDLNAIVNEYLKGPECEMLLTYYPNVKIQTRLGSALMNVSGSPVHLSKTLMNLVSNAAEAMPSGGIISIATRNRYIDKPVKGYDEVEKGDYVVLTVQDTGVGISAEDLDRIFEPFYTKKVMGRSGTGLGMAVVWGTIKDHNGYIDVHSTVGKGTIFTLYFPVTRQDLSKEEPRPAFADLKGNGQSILVVDDALDQREIASNILGKLGYSVSSVSSGEAAVEYIKKHPVDLLVLDMIMDPGIDGYETYKQILKIHPNQKAVIASGFSETKRVKEAQKLGAGAYIKKPYLLQKIGLAVKEELSR